MFLLQRDWDFKLLYALRCFWDNRFDRLKTYHHRQEQQNQIQGMGIFSPKAKQNLQKYKAFSFDLNHLIFMEVP